MNENVSAIVAILGAFAGLSGAIVAVIVALSNHRNESRRTDADAKKANADAEKAESDADATAADTALKILAVLREQVNSQGGEIKELRREIEAMSADRIKLQLEINSKDNEIFRMKIRWEQERVELQQQIDQLREQVVALGGKPVVPASVRSET